MSLCWKPNDEFPDQPPHHVNTCSRCERQDLIKSTEYTKLDQLCFRCRALDVFEPLTPQFPTIDPYLHLIWDTYGPVDVEIDFMMGRHDGNVSVRLRVELGKSHGMPAGERVKWIMAEQERFYAIKDAALPGNHNFTVSVDIDCSYDDDE